MPFRFKIGRDGKQKLEKIPDRPEFHVDGNSCGLCGGSGIVEEHQFCSCEAGQKLRREELHIPKPKISIPPLPTNNDLSAFDQNKNLGKQLDLFDES